MKVGYLQYDVKHSCEENFEIIEKYLKRTDFDIILLPELSLCGYLFKSREELEKAAEEVPSGFSVMRMMKLSEKYSCAIIFGMAEKIGKRRANVICGDFKSEINFHYKN